MKAFWFGAMLLLVLLLMAGCGVAQEKYNAVVGERDTAKAQVASLQGDLEKAQKEVEKTQKEVKTLKDELSAAKAKYSDLELKNASIIKQLDALKEESAKLKRLAIFNTTFCWGRPEYGKYTVKPNNTYVVTEMVWLCFDTTGWKYELIDGKWEVNIEVEGKAVDGKGEIVAKWAPIVKEEYERPVYASFWYSWQVGMFKQGDYTVEVVISDRNSGETANWKGQFKVIP